jgi:hypothetical protein
VQSAKTVSLTQEQLEIHVTRLCTEIKVLDDKEQATAYETEAVKLLLEQRVTLLEEDLQAVRNRWKQEVGLSKSVCNGAQLGTGEAKTICRPQN